MERRNWQEFRLAGLLWYINKLLHLFGWAIVIDIKDDEIVDVYPARTKHRGFSEESNTRGYERLTKHMNDNSEFLASAFEKGKKEVIQEKVRKSDLRGLVADALTMEENKK